ncbi:hypothetical protein [Aquimarina sp. 2201CG5-10]|uniref:hypothetical protein n=1 Tax=Aquimarina callyspongiae TaxID=3098150 RepID=UPI002AB59598|nr:hypothetical protein [Aquimarina sp. 2201CG5-10]MDY8136446.1 hypothetical protein [Aquimarina sp. 2201CG5-10]
MKICKRYVTIVITIIAFTSSQAQTNDTLIGKWETSYEEDGEKAYVTYEFKKVKEELKCYTLSIKNDKGEGGKYNSLAMKNIILNNGKGKAKYVYNEKGKNYVFDAKLNLKNENTLNISYSYWGYSNTEIWKRIE